MKTALTAAGPRHLARDCAGFSLLEVMVAVIVLSVGLLGIARMQSLALSSTAVANKRSLAAIEADSLAATMHTNRGYWTTGDPSNATISIQGTTLSITGGAPALSAAGSPVCDFSGGPCTPAQLAAYDLNQWAASLQSLLPSDQATISCNASTTVSCTINVVWAENAVAVNTQEAQQTAAAAPAAILNTSYTLYVEP